MGRKRRGGTGSKNNMKSKKGRGKDGGKEDPYADK